MNGQLKSNIVKVKTETFSNGAAMKNPSQQNLNYSSTKKQDSEYTTIIKKKKQRKARTPNKTAKNVKHAVPP